MSAFVVPNSHITVLAVFIAQRDLCPGRSVQEIGEILLNENIESIRFRYPDDRENYMGFEIDERAAFLRPALVQIVKAANCLEYQSCEHNDYQQSEAYRMTKAVSALALRLLSIAEKRLWSEDTIYNHPDYDRCAWVVDFEIEQPAVA